MKHFGKTVLKSVGITLAALLVAFIMLFIVFALVFPSVMANASAQLNLYGAAAFYSSLEYDRSGKVEDAAQAAEYALFSGNDRNVERYGETLIEHPDFYLFCAKKNEAGGDYQQYICGVVAVAKYHLGKADEALELVFSVNSDSFPPNNAIIHLTLAAAEKDDTALCGAILTRLDAFAVPAAQREDLENIKTILKEIANE